jgi:hypothetical protein
MADNLSIIMNLQEIRNKKRTEERSREKIKIFLDGTKDEKKRYKIKADKEKELIKYILKLVDTWE